MRSAECGIPVPRSNRECGQSRQCQPLNSAFLIPHSALSGGPMFPGLAPRGQCVVCGCVDSSRATCARRSARIRQSSANAATVRTSAAASVGIQWSKRSIMAPEGGERSNQRRRSKRLTTPRAVGAQKTNIHLTRSLFTCASRCSSLASKRAKLSSFSSRRSAR